MEILTAITILAIVMTLVYSAFGRTADTIQRVSSRADVQHKASVIFSRITEEIVAADWESGNMRTIHGKTSVVSGIFCVARASCPRFSFRIAGGTPTPR